MIVIVGGGISGLAIGWYLAREGRPVTIVERDEAGHGATWAAAGMLAPYVEAEPGEEQLLPLLLESHGRWASFASELEEAAGMAVDYRTEGFLVVALDRDDRERLEHQYEYQRSLGLEIEWLTGYRARKLEPHLARSVAAALFSPHDHHVNNRKVAIALRKAFLRVGGTLRERSAVRELLISNGEVQGVRLEEERIEAENVIVAAGAWSRDLPGLPENTRPPVRPVKGQMVAVQMEAAAPLLQHVVWGPDAYLVPRNDGRLLIGATVEEKGYDTQLTTGGIFELLRGAWELLPGIYDLPIDEMWSGLRPGSRDDAPILGPTAVQGLIMATGHHRNGILLAPITAAAISRLVLAGELPAVAEPFTMERFSGKLKRW